MQITTSTEGLRKAGRWMSIANGQIPTRRLAGEAPATAVSLGPELHLALKKLHGARDRSIQRQTKLTELMHADGIVRIRGAQIEL